MMPIVDRVALILAAIGGLNWGSVLRYYGIFWCG